MTLSVLVRLDPASVASAIAAGGAIVPGVASADLRAAIARGLGFGSVDEAVLEGDRSTGVVWDGVDHGMAAFLAALGVACPAGALRKVLADSIVDHVDLERAWLKDIGGDAELDRDRLAMLSASARDIDGLVVERRPLDLDRDDVHSFGIAVYRRDNALAFQCWVHAHEEAHALGLAGRRLGQVWRAIQMGLSLAPVAVPFPMDADYDIEVERRPALGFGLEYFKLGEAILAGAFRQAPGKRKLVRTTQLSELAKLLIGTDPGVRQLWAAGHNASFSLRWIASVPSLTMSTQISPWPDTSKGGVGLTEVTREVLQVMAFHRACNVRTARFEGRLGECCLAPASATLRALLRHPSILQHGEIRPLTDYLATIGLPGLARRVEAQARR